MQDSDGIAASAATDEKDFIEYKRMKREEEARANILKIECDCLSPNADKQQLKELCKSANAISLGAVVVFPAYVKACVSFLGSDPKTSLIAEISYPHGLEVTEIKVAAIKRAIKDGVDEVEVCAPVQLIRDGNIAYFKRECKKIRKAAKNVPLRLVLDCEVLRGKELSKVCAIAAEAGIPCLRLNGADGETVSDIKQALRGKCLIKADGAESFSAFANFSVMGADYIASRNALSLASLVEKQSKEI